MPEQWTKTKLTREAVWHAQGWTGAVLPYAALTKEEKPGEKLLDFLQHVHGEGSRLMK